MILSGEGRQHGLVVVRWWRQRFAGEVLTQVVAHVLRLNKHHRSTADQGLLSSVFGPPVLTEVLPGGKQFTTFIAGNLFLVWSVLTNSLKEKQIINILNFESNISYL